MMLKKFLILFALIFALLVPAGAWADVTVTTFDELVEAVSDDESGDITLGANIVMTKVIDLDRGVTITGGGYTLTAAASRHFTISAAGVTLDGITFEGSYSGGGVSVSSSGGVTFSGTTAFNNTSADNGGAVNIAASATATFSGTATFTGNAASSSGGAIYSAGTVTFASSATFTSNTASSSGGAIDIASGGTATFSGTAEFTGNTASSNGGAINSAGTVSFASATFGGTDTADSNKATNGGAIYATGSLSFTGAATFTTNVASGDGGAIYASTMPTFSSTAEFNSNTAANDGGAVYLSGTDAVTLSSSYTFTGNKTTAGSGGAVYAKGAVTISGAKFTDANTANANGGAVYAEGNLTVSSGTFTYNTAVVSGDSSGSGGALYSTGTITVSGGTFTSNTAAVNGGAAYAGGTLSVTGGTFEKNEASGNGGAVYSAGALTLGSTSSAGTFTSNVASVDGGAAYSGGNIIVNLGEFTSNIASGNGGAIGASGTITLNGASFDVNEAADSGGAVYSAGNIIVNGGEFTGNTADSGGAIGSAGKVTLNGIEFTTTNTATGSSSKDGGGAIWANEIEFASDTANKFSNQRAENGYGGAIFVQDHITMNSGSTVIFENNHAELSGGAVRIDSSTSLTSLSRISFINNQSVSGNGGAIYTTSPITITRCYFINNKSGGNGGALGTDGSENNVTLTSSYFVNNSAVDNASSNIKGGAVYIYRSASVSIEQSTFANNTADANSGSSMGGAVYTYDVGTSTALINNSFYCNNANSRGNSNSYGGAVYLNESGNGRGTVSFCTFTGNRAYNAIGINGFGGGFAVNNGSITILGSLIVGNEATLDKGSDVWQSSSATLSSAGDNRVVSFANTESSLQWSNSNGVTGATDDETGAWTAVTFFAEIPVFSDASAGLLSFVGPTVGADDDIKLPTIPLDPNKDGAIDMAVNTKNSAPKTDQVGTTRPQPSTGYPDIGAYEYPTGGSGDDGSNPYADYTIRSIELSGIPNTLSIVGQTAILHATVTYINGTRTTTAEPLTWKSSDTNVAEFENESSGAIYTKSIGEATITVSARDGAYSDSAKIYVIWEQEDTNIHPNVLNLVNQLNLQLDNDNINFYIMANAPDDANLLTDKKFTSEFQKAYNSKPSFADYDSNNFSSNSSFSRAAKSGLKDSFTPGINTALNNQYAGLLLPVFCTWEFEFADLADEFNIDEEELYSMSDAEFSSWLFKNINIGFARTNGNFLPAVSSSNQSSLQSASKAKAKAAASSSSGALSVNRGGDSVTVSMRAYLANVTPNGSEGSSLISDSTGTKRLIIPAGSNPISNTANISGTIWTTKLASSSSNNSDSDSDSSSGSGKKSGGGGGGGCSSLNLNLIALILLALLFNRKHA